MDQSNVSLDQFIQVYMENLKRYKYPTNKQEQLRKKHRESLLREILKTKVFVTPIMGLLKQLIAYQPNINKQNDDAIITIEKHLVNLSDTSISLTECENFVKLSRAVIEGFPVTVWRSLISSVQMTHEQIYFFSKFWSIFSQTLLLYEKAGRKRLYSLTQQQRQELIQTVVDPDTLYGYIMSTGPVQPIDVLNILLEYHGLSYKAPYGLQARDLFVKLFMQHSGKLDAMLDACEKSTTTIRGSITLKQWLTSNKQLLYRLYDMIGFSIAFNREPINIYLDPTVLCNKCDIKYVTFPSHNGIKKTPLVAELIKPTQYNGHLIVALCATDIMLLDITDLEVFNKVREFEKLYCGKIAIVCSLGIHVSHTYKPPSDLVLIDLTTARKVFI